MIFNNKENAMSKEHLRTLIYEQGVGGRDEHWWYLCFDQDQGVFYIEHQQDYTGYKAQSDLRNSELLFLVKSYRLHFNIVS